MQWALLQPLLARASRYELYWQSLPASPIAKSSAYLCRGLLYWFIDLVCCRVHGNAAQGDVRDPNDLNSLPPTPSLHRNHRCDGFPALPVAIVSVALLRHLISILPDISLTVRPTDMQLRTAAAI